MSVLQKFIDRFNLPSDGFSTPIPFIDTFGFSTTKDRIQDGLTFVSIYKFYVRKDDFEKNSQPKPLIIAVDYGERRDDGEVLLSPTSIPRKRDWPVSLISTDEFFYNTITSKFYHGKNEVVAYDLLRRVERGHLLPTRPLRGRWFRFKLLIWHSLIVKLLKVIYWLFRQILYWFFGKKAQEKIWLIRANADSPDRDDETPTPEPFAKETIDLFGYRASAWAVVTYAVIHLIAYTAWFISDRSLKYFANIVRNAFLTTIYVIPTLVFYERWLSSKVWSVLKVIGLGFQKAAFKQFRIPL